MTGGSGSGDVAGVGDSKDGDDDTASGGSGGGGGGGAGAFAQENQAWTAPADTAPTDPDRSSRSSTTGPIHDRDGEWFTTRRIERFSANETEADLDADAERKDQALAPRKYLTRCAFSPTALSEVAYCDNNGFVTVRDLNGDPNERTTIKKRFSHSEEAAYCLAYSPDGGLLVVAGGRVMKDGDMDVPRVRV